MSESRSVAIILVRGGRVFVAKRPPGGDLGGRWEFPGGKLEQGESDADAVAREFMEEFGVRAEADRLLGEGSFVHRGTRRSLAAWLADLDPGAEPLPLEHREARWATANELGDLDLADSDKSILPYVLPLLKA